MFEDLLKTMSLEEKAKMMTGKDFWHLFELEQAKLPSIMVCDGPHGLRKQPNDSDPLGLGNSVPATCFPPACTSASSWDKELLKGIGKRIGEECVAEQVAVVLGPGANIKRSPLCGRNFEYFSEDPLLSGKMASSFIQGVQSQGVGTSLKHFVANNQEANRLVVDAIIDERTFREIYLKSFEIPVREALPWTVMCSYNKVNGEYMSENNKVLNEILRKEWGFDGLVMTDWGAANNRAKGIASGLDLEMPGNPNSAARLVKAVKDGRLKETELDLALSRILALIQKGAKAQTICKPYDQEEHHQFARLVAAESTVLLKNDGVLPFSKEKSLAIIGAFAKHPRYQGNGSSLIRPTKLVSAFDAFHEILGDQLFYAEGYPLGLDVVQPELISQALEMAKKADQVLVMVGLTESFESEGYDREHLSLPISQIALIASLLRERKDIAIAISNGSAVEMPFVTDALAIVESYLGGQASGEALRDVIFGDINPSGKLAETFPNHAEEFPVSHFFPGTRRQVLYAEGPYIGYRFYDSANLKPLFPFGHGLSYTTFAYSNLEVQHAKKRLTIAFDVTNTGDVFGKEISQIYVSKLSSAILRVDKELKGFEKTALNPQETKRVTVTIPDEDLSVFVEGSWKLEDGMYLIKVGSSSQVLPLEATIQMTSKDMIATNHLEAYENIKSNFKPSPEDFEKLLGYPVPPVSPLKPYSLNTTVGEIRHTLIGKLLLKMIQTNMKKMLTNTTVEDGMLMMVEKMLDGLPLRALVMMSGNAMKLSQAEGLVYWLNKRFFKGIVYLLK